MMLLEPIVIQALILIMIGTSLAAATSAEISKGKSLDHGVGSSDIASSGVSSPEGGQ